MLILDTLRQTAAFTGKSKMLAYNMHMVDRCDDMHQS